MVILLTAGSIFLLRNSMVCSLALMLLMKNGGVGLMDGGYLGLMDNLPADAGAVDPAADGRGLDLPADAGAVDPAADGPDDEGAKPKRAEGAGATHDQASETVRRGASRRKAAVPKRNAAASRQDQNGGQLHGPDVRPTGACSTQRAASSRVLPAPPQRAMPPQRATPPPRVYTAAYYLQGGQARYKISMRIERVRERVRYNRVNRWGLRPRR